MIHFLAAALPLIAFVVLSVFFIERLARRFSVAHLIATFGMILGLFVTMFIVVPLAFAQQPGDIVNAVCSDQGKSLLVWALGVIGVANAIAWSKTMMGKLPAPVQAFIHFAALNWPTIGRAFSNAAAMAIVIITAATLAACSGTSINVTPLPAADAQLMFKNACAGISTAHGMFQADAPALVVAGKLTSAQISQEKSIFTVASTRCDNPPVDATGKVDYQALAIDTAGDAATVYLLLHGPQ